MNKELLDRIEKIQKELQKNNFPISEEYYLNKLKTQTEFFKLSIQNGHSDEAFQKEADIYLTQIEAHIYPLIKDFDKTIEENKSTFNTFATDTNMQIGKENIKIQIKKDKINKATMMGLDITQDLQKIDRTILVDLLKNKHIDFNSKVNDTSLSTTQRLAYQNAKLILSNTVNKIADEARNTNKTEILEKMLDSNLISSNYYFKDEESLSQESNFRQTLKKFFAPEEDITTKKLTQDEIIKSIQGLDESFALKFKTQIAKTANEVNEKITPQQEAKAQEQKPPQPYQETQQQQEPQTDDNTIKSTLDKLLDEKLEAKLQEFNQIKEQFNDISIKLQVMQEENQKLQKENEALKAQLNQSQRQETAETSQSEPQQDQTPTTTDQVEQQNTSADQEVNHPFTEKEKDQSQNQAQEDDHFPDPSNKDIPTDQEEQDYENYQSIYATQDDQNIPQEILPEEAINESQQSQNSRPREENQTIPSAEKESQSEPQKNTSADQVPQAEQQKSEEYNYKKNDLKSKDNQKTQSNQNTQ